MNILYVAGACSRKKYAEYVESKGARASQQAQKYNLLLAEGLAANGADVHMTSSRPINRGVSRQFWFKAEAERANGIRFSYVPFANYPVLRNIFVLVTVFLKVLFSKDKRSNTTIVCDALNVMAAMGALMASAVRGYHTVGIVTDVPCHYSNMEHISFNQKLNLWLIRKFKSYLLMTEAMNEIVNPKGYPHIVLEGHSDVSMAQMENRLEDKHSPRVCLYAGALMKIYGIGILVEGFLEANIPNTELHLYGNGDFTEELEEICAQHRSVKYMGIAPNSEIVKAELAATLLINPRPTNEEYTKYSFPSKNMEYMASGTPVLTTRLPGMPADHEPYMYFIEEENSHGVAEALTRVLSKTPEELHAFGLNAKHFAMAGKNNKAQAKKMLRFMANSIGLEINQSETGIIRQ